MANRIRSVKPEILEDEKTAFLSHLEYRLFIGSWIVADDYGNMRGDPDYLRCQIVWASRETRETVADALSALERSGLLVRYTVRGQTYYHIPNFGKHQRIDKPGKPKCPGRDQDDGSESIADNDSRNDSRNDSSNDSRTGRESVGSGLGSGIREREWEGERDVTRSPRSAKRERVDLGSEHVQVTAEFDRRYRAKYSAKPTWGSKQGAIVNRLLKKHGCAEVVRRMAILFEHPPSFLTGSATDIGTLEQHFDKLAVPSGQRAPPTSPVLQTLLGDIALMEREEELRKAGM